MKKRSFFEKLTGVVKLDEHDEDDISLQEEETTPEEETDGQLAIDMYQTPTEIVIKTMVAGVKPEDLDISITRDMATIKGHREESNDVIGNDFFHKELYWGTFSRTVMLPEEIDVETTEAINKNGLLIITMPKVDKNKQAKVRVKSA
jgi:HSP20 family protein